MKLVARNIENWKYFQKLFEGFTLHVTRFTIMVGEPVTKQELEELLGESQQVIIEAVDYKFQDIEKHLMRIEDSLDKTYGAILERHDSLLVKIARKLGLEEELEP